MNILIVDDEQIILDGIRLLIEQSGYSFSAIYTANSASQALQILKEQKIHILFSDIKMPGMDGFELIGGLKKERPELILITGFAEFEYVKKAIDAGVLGYILKPIDEEQFLETLQKAVRNVLKKQTTRPEQLSQANQVQMLFPVLFGGGSLRQGEQQLLEQVIGTEKNYLLLGFHLKIEERFSSEFGLAVDVVYRSAEEYFEKNRREQFYFFRSEGEMRFHCLCVSDNPISDMAEFCERFVRNIRNEPGFCIPVELCISLSDERKKLSRELYAHCREAYFDRYLNPEKRVLAYTASSLQMVSGIENDLKVLEVNISESDMRSLQKNLEQIFSVSYIKNSGLTVRAVYFMVANTVILTFHRLRAEVENTFVEELLSEKAFERIDRVEELAQSVYEATLEVVVKQKNAVVSSELTIKKIVHYVNTNFDQDLSIKQLSAKFGLTPNYLSQIFKAETGENFVVYLNILRINKACELLRGSDIKIFEIGRLVGYKDSQYFHRVFKKYVNQTPIEYRMGKD